MAADPIESKGFSLRRWSQRKHAATRDPVRQVDAPPAPVALTGARPTPGVENTASDARSAADTETVSTPAKTVGEPAKLAVPPLESLTIESDYSPFMQPGVDAATKHRALKKLFSDPRFNVMDGLDVYIDDYSKPDPIDPAIVRTLNQARYIFNPPPTRVNAEGHVEDVPEEELAKAAEVEPLEAPADAQTLPSTGDAPVAIVEANAVNEIADDNVVAKRP